MTDLGFGLADKRSVMVVLFVFLLSNILFNHAMPIDTTSAIGLFTSLVTLTGFLFAVRTVCRILLASAYTIGRMTFDLYAAHKDRWVMTMETGPGSAPGPDFDKEVHKTSGPRLMKDLLRRWWWILTRGVSGSFTQGILVPLIDAQEWEWKALRVRYFAPMIGVGVLGVLDRLLLIAIAFAATLPSLSVVRQNIGLVGIGLLLLAYVLTGRFTIVLKDAFQKDEEDHDRLVAAAANPSVRFPSVIETRPHIGSDR